MQRGRAPGRRPLLRLVRTRGGRPCARRHTKDYIPTEIFKGIKYMFLLKLPFSMIHFILLKNYFINDYINRNHVCLCTRFIITYSRLISNLLVMSRISYSFYYFVNLGIEII